MSSYYSDEDDIDIRIRHGRGSPIYPDHRHAPIHPPVPPPAQRPIIYTHGPSYRVPEYRDPSPPPRPRSIISHRASPERAPIPPPVIINNRVYNDYEDEDEDEDARYLQLSRPLHHRSRSRSRPRSFVSPRSSREDYELEQARKELEAYKLEAEREKEEKRIKEEMELKRLRDEKRAKEEKERLRKEAEKAVEEFKQKEAEKAAKEKKEKEQREKEKEEREKEYKRRLQEDLRKSGMDEKQIAAVLKKEKFVEPAPAPARETYTRMSRKYLSIETLNRYRIDYEFDMDPEYVLIKRWVPEHEQDLLWNHTREIRELRQPTTILAIEGKKKHHEPEFEFVRKKKHHERKPSPSALLTYLAGGRR